MTSDNDLRQAAHINARRAEAAAEITRLKAEVRVRQTIVEEARDERDAALAENERLRAEISYLDKAYVNLLEAGRDKIIELGGDCDPVEVMEKADPALRRARAALTPAQEKTDV